MKNKFTTYLFIGLTIFLTLQEAKTADQDLFLLPGDTSNYYVEELFNRNVVDSKKNKNLKQDPEASYTTNNPAARISSVQEVNADFLSGPAKDCTNSKIFKLQGGGESIYLACYENIEIFDVQQDNSLVANGEIKVGNPVWDYHMVDSETKQVVSLSIDPSVTPGVTAYSFDFILHTTPSVEIKIDQKDWQASAIQNKASFEIWQFTDGATPPVITPFWVGYQREYDLTSTTSANYLLWAKSDDPAVTGKLDLTAANNFPEDAVLITDLSFNDQNTLLITYKGAADTLKTAECIMAFATNVVSITSCTASTSTPPVKSGNIVIEQPIAATPGISYIYNDENRRLSICTYNAGTYSACTNSAGKIVYGDDQQFFQIKVDATGLNLWFVKKGTTQVKTTIYNINKVVGDIQYDQISDRNGFTSCSDGAKGYLIKSMSYSVYAQNKDMTYVQLISDEFTQASQDVTITQTIQTESKTFTFNVNILQDINVGAKIKNIPDYQDYNRESVLGNKLSINRRSFQGNNLDFELSLAGFTVLNANEFDFDTASLGKNVYFFDYQHGIAVDAANKVTAITCTGTILEKNFNCALNTKITYDIPAGASLIHVQPSSSNTEKGLVLVSSDNKDTHVAYIDFVDEEAYFGSITGVKSQAGKLTFKVIKGTYSFWIIDTVGLAKVTVYGSSSKMLAGITLIKTIDNTVIKKKAGNFCPVGFSQNGLITGRMDIMSYCATGESRIWRLNAVDPVTIDIIAEEPSKLVANTEAGTGALSFCNLGQEYLVLNPTTNFAYSTDVADDYSINGLGYTAIGYTGIQQIFCRGGTNAIIAGVDGAGDKWFSVLFGNKIGDIRDRYHSSVKYTGSIDSVVQTETGFIVNTLDGANYKFYSILVNGPTIYYNGQKQAGPQDVTLQITQLGEAVGSKQFTFSLTDFEEKIEATPKEASESKTTTGTYKIFDIADISGPIFNIKVEVGPDVNSTITVKPQYTKDGEYQPTQTVSPEPQSIVTEGTSSVGIYTAGNSLQFYYYKNFDSFQEAIDVGKNSKVADAAINNDEALVSAYNVNEGGIYQLRAFIYTFATKTPSDYLILNDYQATSVHVEKINSQTFAVVAVNQKEHTGRAFILTVGSTTPTASATFNNSKFYYIIIFS